MNGLLGLIVLFTVIYTIVAAALVAGLSWVEADPW